MVYEFKTAQAFELDWLDEFYVQCGYAAKVGGQDQVVFAFCGQTPIGVGRVSREHGFSVLRGMQVVADHRRRGVGKKILEHLLPLVGSQRCFCLSYRWLVGLYKNSGFMCLAVEKAPRFIQDRYRDYRARGLDVLLLVYDNLI